MDAFYKNLGFKKMDELDQNIELKSVQWTWRVTIIFLVIIEIICLILMWNYIIPADFLGIPMFLIFIQDSLMIGFRCFFRLQILDKGSDRYKRNILGLIGNIAFLILSASMIIIIILRNI